MYEIRKFFSKEDFEKLNEYARGLDYSGIVNPEDLVEYPNVSAEVPEWVKAHVEDRIFEMSKRRLRVKWAFFRLSDDGTPVAPHQAHTDTVMGQFTFLLYMQDAPEGVKAGTSLVKHKTVGGLHQDPWTSAEHEVWQKDHSDPEKWVIWKFFEMERNKGVLYESKLMHRAEPVGGFGSGIEDGRLVLTCFLERANG